MTELSAAPEVSAGAGRDERLPYVDNLRVALTVLVVLHHVAVTYGDFPVWYYTEKAEDPSGKVLDVFVILNQAFFMGFFFMIAGYFTPGSYGRKGPRPFLRDRWKRLGIPLLAFLLLIRPMVNFDSFGAVREAFAESGHGLPYWVFYLVTWDAGPMWFVEVLLLFAVVYVRVRRRRPSVPAVTGVLRGRSVVAFGVGLTVATYAWRIAVPAGTYVPVLGLPTPNYLPQYASFFAVGVLAWRRGWAASLSRRAGRLGFAVAAAATAGYAPVAILSPQRALDGRGTWQSLAAAGWESVFAIGMVIGLAVLFRERFGRQGPRGAFLSRHAFAVYLTHPVVLVGLGHGFRWLDAPAVVKFAITGALALPLCWGLAWAVRRLPRADRVL